MSEVDKGPLARREEAIQQFWAKEHIFQKSLEKESPKGEYVFYDGPPFASGSPHYGHMLASTIKDAIPRYRTMCGYHVARQWGWDCHGLPVENLVEKELGFKTKRDIEEFGLQNFNETARVHIMKDVDEWKQVIPRLGRWADMEHDYKTMDTSYTESVWWAFKTLYDKGLAYEGFKAMHLCPRCGTTLSNFEVAQGYKDIPDWSVTVKLPLVDEPETSLLVWTTTPWTLPGNTAAAVNPAFTYVKVKQGSEFFVIAKDRLSAVFPENPEVIGEIAGKELIGKRYLPPFEYFATELHKHKTHAWKVYGADYVTTEDGTGLVHLAPAFGEEDLLLAQKEKIPLIHHVGEDGKFTAQVSDLAGLPVKPKGRHTETDEKVIALLQQKGVLFKAEKITHSYPHCWRCDTPLLNYATTSWFVNVQKIKPALVAQNARIEWIPDHVGTGRFGKWLENARDWAITRSRYWGAPLPVWRNKKTKEMRVVGSINELLSLVRRSGNRYFVMRHAEANSNVADVIDSGLDTDNHLTQKGIRDIEHTAAELRKADIDLIIASPVLRAQETARELQKALGLPDSALMSDERLQEINVGEFQGKPVSAYRDFFADFSARTDTTPQGGENYRSLRRRVGEFLFEVERRYTGKNILIVTHAAPAYQLFSVAGRKTIPQAMARGKDDDFIRNAEMREMPFTPYPHNPDYVLDLHRPYIDDIPLGNTLEGEWHRETGVFDCWFESGSMPFASRHYPFLKKQFNPKRFFGLAPKGYPADFIAEGLDQTRGWFYSLIVLGVALFGKAPYRSVIVNGLILAENGEKMSKRLKNYPDPMEVIDRYGADALRYYLLSSPVIRAEDLRFSQKGVEDVSKKILMRLDNVCSFYELYASGVARHDRSTHPLDRWIVNRYRETLARSTEGYERYVLDDAVRPLADLVDDLSTWYVRRSRDRFKSQTQDTTDALATLRYVLFGIAQVMAPVMPFFADELFGRVKESTDAESVHLTNWPEPQDVDSQLLADMKQARAVASQALEQRERLAIKIRQPLQKLMVRELSSSLSRIIAEEVNVKEVIIDAALDTEVQLDTTITPELQREGTLRDLVRVIQDFRKEQKLTIADRPTVTMYSNNEGQRFITENESSLKELTGIAAITHKDGGEQTSSVPFPLTLEL